MRRDVTKKTIQILKEEPYSRENDGYLIRRVIEEIEPNLYKNSFKTIMDNIQFTGISFESITRARRKFFEENPNLKIETTDQASREKEHEYYLEYANHISSI